jgi:hypothetical protein
MRCRARSCRSAGTRTQSSRDGVPALPPASTADPAIPAGARLRIEHEPGQLRQWVPIRNVPRSIEGLHRQSRRRPLDLYDTVTANRWGSSREPARPWHTRATAGPSRAGPVRVQEWRSFGETILQPPLAAPMHRARPAQVPRFRLPSQLNQSADSHAAQRAAPRCTHVVRARGNVRTHVGREALPPTPRRFASSEIPNPARKSRARRLRQPLAT